MRYRSTHLLRKTGLSALIALLWALGTGVAQAQLPVFKDIDWLLDRGNLSFDPVTTSGVPLRMGTNNFANPANSPGHGYNRYTFPRTFDETNGTTADPSLIVDNPNVADPQNYSDTSFNNVRTSSVYAMQAGLNPQQMAHAYLTGAWTLPLVPADLSVNDYRSPQRGFSLTSDSSLTYSYDYAFTLATHNDFLIDLGNNQTRPATAGELAALPYTSTAVYAGVQKALINDNHPMATYSSGSYNLLPGNYGVDIYSPGDGTFIGGVVHPNVTRALVRVSWNQTVNANGNIVRANTENPVFSRIYEVDLSQAGWIHIQGGGTGQAVFPFDGNPQNQIAVTVYSITPDNYSGAGDPIFASAPLVTADAVRFVARTGGGPGLVIPATPNPPGLPAQVIAPVGRILGPAVGTNKLLFTSKGVPIADVQPLVFFAREESVPDPRPTFPTDPTLPISPSNPPIADPTATISAPVFYCIDSQDGNVAGLDTDGFLPSFARVRWRYVGIADAASATGTSAASPAIANVRCRDGITRTIVYFLTTDATGTLGHIYAFDAAGNRAFTTTQNYWIYPSYRPLTPAELAANKLPPQAHDPNYLIPAAIPNPYGGPAWGADIADPFFHYDGEIVKNPNQADEYIVRTDTQIAAFGGVQGSPVIIDDPAAPAGGQILVIGNMNGRVYAFDAGGRGDFNQSSIVTTGTTQRIWTWPHFGADAYYAKNLNLLNPPPVNRIADEPSLGTILGSMAYDPAYPSVNLTTKPMIVPGGDGHLYAINMQHDTVPAYNANTGRATWQERRNWVYPAPDNAGLGGALTTPAIFQPTGASLANIYFNCEGRTYAVPEAPPVIFPTLPTTNVLKWAFPQLNDPNGPLVPGFNGTAPVLLSSGILNSLPAFAGSPAVNNDYCYVLEGNSTLFGLDASTGALLATGTTLTGGSTSCTPIATGLIGSPNYAGTSAAASNPQPTLVFADDNGGIYGLAARPDTANAGPDGGFLMSMTWAHHETLHTRIAAAALFDGYILEGDEGGQMRAYGPGNGPTDSPGEPTEIALGAGDLSIDMRILDFYKKVDYDRLMLTAPGGLTANRKNVNGGFQFQALPAPGNITDSSRTGAIAVDWGDYMYVAAAGVYHAQPNDGSTSATGPPSIQVTFSLVLPNNRGIITQTVQVPAVTQVYNSLWPDDKAITNNEHNSLSIYGIDANMGMPTAKLLTGPQENVYPWIAKAQFLIDPNATSTTTGVTANYTPGSRGYRVSASATITQPSVNTAISNTLSAGQTDYNGLTTQLPTQSTSPAAIGNFRRIAVTNPIAVTTRGITNVNDMTGAANRNVIGLYPSINSLGPKPANVGELLNNGNGETIPNVNNAVANTAVKSVFAPLPMVPDGSTSTYSAIDNVGNPQNALFIVDRSNIRGALGRSVQIQVVPGKLYWHGWGPSSNPTATGSAVMNALPWELLPNDAQDTVDYPGIPKSAFTIQKSTGEDAVSGRVALSPPNYLGGVDPSTTRQLTATAFNLQVKVPRYQPANVNYGVNTFNGTTFGSVYTDLSGVNRGDPNGGSAYDQHILGPLFTTTGDQAPLGSAAAYPAGGYISGFEVQVISSLTGAAGSNGNAGGGYSPVNAFNNARRAGASPNGSGSYAAREVETGISVPPSVKMRVAESPLDLGKLPHGTGYTPLTDLNNARSFQVPFVPDMQPSVPGPPYWDDPNRGGQFFLPFTLYNESNVNLVDLRIAKLLGQNNSQISGKTLSQYTDPTVGNENGSTATSLQLTGDQVNSQSNSPLYAVPFKNVSGQPGVGNAGIVSSWDHISSSSNPVSSLFPERPLWPIANPFVVAADIASANQNYGAMLPTANNLGAGIMGWADNLQPQPTVGKPRVGDGQGRTATIPDQPYSGNATYQRPRIGVAIPLGTPVGTYSAPVYAFEDNTPIQWQEWLSHYSKPAGVSQNYPVSHDGILNISKAGTPIESHSDPTFVLKVTVREAKLSREVTTGDQPMLDPFGSWNDPNHPGFVTPPGSENFPAAYMAPGGGGNVFNRNLYLYWSTNRQQGPNGYIGPNGLPRPYAPFTIDYSHVPAPYSGVNGTNIILGDFDFANQLPIAGNGASLSAWWKLPFLYDAVGNVPNLFPSAPAGNIPFLPGQANVDTTRLVHPAVAASVDFSGGYNALNPNDSEAYLFFQGQVDKVTGANSGNFQTRDSRILWVRLFGGNGPGEPAGQPHAMPDDPTLNKLAPRPLLVKLPAANGAPAEKFLYVFWHQGNQSNASIYYNAMTSTNLATVFDNGQWLVDINNNRLGDTKLPTPGALVWESDPAPIYRHIPNPYNANQMIDVVDVVFTGVLKGRQTVETLLSRYKINRTPPVNPGDPPVGSLTLLPVRKVVGEVLTRIGNSNTYQARDAAWELGTGPLGTLDPVNDKASQIGIYRVPGGGAGPGAVLLNPQAAPNQNLAQLGTYDQASGLLYYNSTLGGQIVVDMRSGTVRFPQVAPALADRLQISYIPFVMRLNTSRDDSNIDRTLLANFGNLAGVQGFQPTAAITSSGNNTSPVVIFDRGLNPRTLLTAPQVVFPNGANPTLDRMWVLYRKNDPSGVVKSTIYYKSMRLMVKLPFPVLLQAPSLVDGSQQMVPVSVNGNVGPYEVDFSRGRIYFTEADENSQITVNYSFYDPVSKNTAVSGNLVYRVAWGDEITASIQQGDQTTPEVALPTDSAVSEGQVAAFKDPFLDKLWVFWSSTRAGSTDLYYETIAPQLYPTFSNQR